MLRHDRIGDVLVTVPFLRALRSTYPKIEIDMLFSDYNISAKRAVDSFTNNIYVYRKGILKLFKLIRQLRSRNYDLIIDLFDNPSTTSQYLIKLINPLYTIGFDKNNKGLYTHIVPLPDKRLVHIVERITCLLMPFGINPSKSDLSLSFRLEPREIKYAKKMLMTKGKKLLAVNLSGSSRAKFWGVENIKSFIKMFSENHSEIDIVIFFTEDYVSEADEIVENSPARKAPPTKSFLRFAAYLSVCNYLLTPDTSAVHLAAAFKIPCVSLHLWTGSEDTGLPWYAYNTPQKTLKTSTNDLSSISPENVCTAFNELILQVER
ncbi:MAG: glycosyltransferase family 9 protein [Candidatus Kapabacteria bacterium]|nr:glycosyltransferase family 9 protein [Candidatus Kapabacteria bacterium]